MRKCGLDRDAGTRLSRCRTSRLSMHASGPPTRPSASEPSLRVNSVEAPSGACACKRQE
jgi:hypothetical protein